MDGVRLLAARFPCGLLTAHWLSCPPRVFACKGGGVIRSGPKSGPLPGGRVENGRAGRSVSSKRYQNHAPGEARSPRALPTFPTARPGSASACPQQRGSDLKNPRESGVWRAAPKDRPAPKPLSSPDRLDLFAPAPADDPDAADPAALAQAATLASGRAMKARQWTEAKALAGLAESYARLGERARGGGQTIETMDLGLMFEVLADDNGVAARRLALDPDRVDDPDRAIKAEYQRRLAEVRQTQTHRHMAMVRRIHAAEAQIRALGGEVTVSQSGFDAMTEVRDWLMSATEALEDVTVTPSPPPGDPWQVGM